MARKSKSRFNLKLWLPVLAGLIFIVVLIFALHRPKKVATIPSTNPATSNNNSSSAGQSPSSSSNTSNTTSSPSTKTSANTPVSTSGAAPITPYGNFVSSHHVGTSTSMYSVCNTTAGATCYIQFTNGSLVRKLTVQTTDSNGATYWYWDTSSASLSSGSWTITAVATLNGETKTAMDVQPLVVQ